MSNPLDTCNILKNMTLLRNFLDTNRKISKWFDHYLPLDMRIDGNKDFLDNVAPKYLHVRNLKIYDIGGGSQPLVSIKTKNEWGLSVVGLDIDSHELESAEPGIYDELVVADLSNYCGMSDADLVICQTTLEHVSNNTGAFQGIASMLKPGAYGLLFTPSRHAWFARLNLALPEALKCKLLFSLFPEKAKGHDGFPAYYDRCSPKEFRQLAAENNLTVVELKPYYISSYFQVFFPLYFIWRIWILLFRYVFKENAAETFTMVIQSPLPESSSI